MKSYPEARGHRPPFACLNCDQDFEAPQLFCGERCKQQAKAVRYARAVIADGRIEKHDVARAVRIKLGMAVAGGYPQAERRVSDSVRRVVIGRDDGKCKVCGEPANELHHLDGSLSEGLNNAENLELRCGRCHMDETLSHFRRATANERIELEALWDRIHAEAPMKACDDHVNWNSSWRALRASRRNR